MRLRKGQSILEYAVLLMVVIVALMIMQVYVKRSYQGRLKQESDSLGQQYSPKHTTGNRSIETTTTSESYSGRGTYNSAVAGKSITVPEGVGVTISNTHTNFTVNETVDSFATE